MRAALALLLLAVGACGDAPPCASGLCLQGDEPASGAMTAQIIWRTYDETGALPALTWIARGDCDLGFNATDGVCTPGDYRSDLDHVWIALASPEADWRTVLVHELLHAHLSRHYGDGDAHHHRTEWLAAQRAAFEALGTGP
jgi:hypothetical protein